GIFPFEDSEDYSPEIHTSNDLIGPSVNHIEQCGIFTRSVLASVMTMSSMLKGPEDLVGVPADGSVELIWLPMEEAASYNIYRDDLQTPFFTLTGTNYMDTEVENGTSYTYFVTAIYGGSGEESFPTNPVTVVPMAPVSFPFMEDFESGAPYWSTEGTWGLSNGVYHSASHSLTDSPNGNYANNLNISAVLHTINLTGVTGGTLSFWIKYSLESGYDYAFLEVTTNGDDWTQLASFNGDVILWQYKEFSLTPYLDHPSVIFRFRLTTDSYLQKDGVYIDDLGIDAWGVGMEEPSADLQDLRIFPNPFHQSSTIAFNLVRSASVRIGITDMDGRTVKTILDDDLPAGKHSFIWDGSCDTHGNTPPGVYTLMISSGNNLISRKIVRLN
ncbi:MAG TPA: FlgD immunoglobulin-like domain containing protein, partial [Bacteroidales bacterium]|nr:FlgD immunoglobulin-like domain containing protein [Bacteroidales bacterium]